MVQCLDTITSFWGVQCPAHRCPRCQDVRFACKLGMRYVYAIIKHHTRDPANVCCVVVCAVRMFMAPFIRWLPPRSLLRFVVHVKPWCMRTLAGFTTQNYDSCFRRMANSPKFQNIASRMFAGFRAYASTQKICPRPDEGCSSDLSVVIQSACDLNFITVR